MKDMLRIQRNTDACDTSPTYSGHTKKQTNIKASKDTWTGDVG